MAARIGQSLLKKNRTLTEHNDYLEEQVGHIAEEVQADTHTHTHTLTHTLTHTFVIATQLSFRVTSRNVYFFVLLVMEGGS